GEHKKAPNTSAPADGNKLDMPALQTARQFRLIGSLNLAQTRSRHSGGSLSLEWFGVRSRNGHRIHSRTRSVIHFQKKRPRDFNNIGRKICAKPSPERSRSRR